MSPQLAGVSAGNGSWCTSISALPFLHAQAVFAGIGGVIVDDGLAIAAGEHDRLAGIAADLAGASARSALGAKTTVKIVLPFLIAEIVRIDDAQGVEGTLAFADAADFPMGLFTRHGVAPLRLLS